MFAPMMLPGVDHLPHTHILGRTWPVTADVEARTWPTIWNAWSRCTSQHHRRSLIVELMQGSVYGEPPVGISSSAC